MKYKSTEFEVIILKLKYIYEFDPIPHFTVNQQILTAKIFSVFIKFATFCELVAAYFSIVLGFNCMCNV